MSEKPRIRLHARRGFWVAKVDDRTVTATTANTVLAIAYRVWLVRRRQMAARYEDQLIEEEAQRCARP